MRTKLPDRRYSSTVRVPWSRYDGKGINIYVTIGFDTEGKAKEVFCADFKAGSANQAIVMDTCILISRLLQHGDLPSELKASMCEPPSLIGTIAEAIRREEVLMRVDSHMYADIKEIYDLANSWKWSPTV